MPITAAGLLYGPVLPFYDLLGVTVKTILSDNAREHSGRSDHEPYHLRLVLLNIEQRVTKVRFPRPNGFSGGMNRTSLDEYFRINHQKKSYESVEEIEFDLRIFI